MPEASAHNSTQRPVTVARVLFYHAGEAGRGGVGAHAGGSFPPSATGHRRHWPPVRTDDQNGPNVGAWAKPRHWRPKKNKKKTGARRAKLEQKGGSTALAVRVSSPTTLLVKAHTCLTSLIGREAVFPGGYDRRHNKSPAVPLYLAPGRPLPFFFLLLFPRPTTSTQKKKRKERTTTPDAAGPWVMPGRDVNVCARALMF